MADKLTPQQAQAVAHRGGPLLVSAAAGSGKTKVLVDRLLGYLTDEKDPADLDEFLIITYTQAAAAELRGKIAARLTERIAAQPEDRHLQKQMQRLFLTKISTVHSFCADLLRQYAYRLDLAPDFRVADENECRELREAVLSDLLDRAYEGEGENGDFRAFVDSQGLGRDDRLVPQIVEQVYDSARCHLDMDGWLEGCLTAAEVEQAEDAADTVWGAYLMADLRDYIACQSRALERCVELADRADGMEKAAANLRSVLFQLKDLAAARTWDEAVSRGAIDYGRLVFPRKNVDEELRDVIKAAREACKKGLERRLAAFSDDSRQVLEDLGQSQAAVRGLIALVRQFGKDYAAAKRSRRCVDFGDLEHGALDLLLGKRRSGPTALAAEVGRGYREVLVDEYQDSNAVQDAIFSALTAGSGRSFLVGDVKQSIYRFRLADPSIFLKKYETFLPVDASEDGPGRKVLLSHNFRSGPEVVEAVNAVFHACMRPEVGGLYYGEAEELREGVPHTPLPGPGAALYALEVRQETYPEEAAFVADRIAQMLRDRTPVRAGDGFRPVEPEDIVILLRSPGSAAAYFQQALQQRGIPCATGSGTDLLQTPQVQTLRALLQIIRNPRQDIPLIAALASPLFGFTANDLAALRARHRGGSFYEAVLASDEPKAQAFRQTLELLRREAKTGSLTALLEKCLELTRLDSVCAAMDGGEAPGADLRTFYELAAAFEQGTARDLGQFLDHLTALEGRGLVSAGASGKGSVSIMSIHKSKGLEFPVVFLCNLSRRFNQESLRAQVLCDQELGLGLSVADEDNRIRYSSVAKRAIAGKMARESVSEELRVLYVAMTRAKDYLLMSYASQNLEADLRQVALRADLDGGELLCREAMCMGDWVLLAAMGRAEAGQLHALGGRPERTQVSAIPWDIRVSAAPEGPSAETPLEELPRPPLPEGVLETLSQALSFRYSHAAATQAPSKQTATGRKGRVKDAEAAEDTDQPRTPERPWRRPAFRSSGGKTYGSAVHLAMQYLCYESCGSAPETAAELQRLVEEGFLTPEQGALVDAGAIARFFATDIGRKLRGGTPYLREFKFSILDSASRYGDGLEDEQVLLQGVVDCALLEEDGITVVDFKTDHVTRDTLAAAAERYRDQVDTYAEALTRIYEQPVKAKLLYFFAADRFVEL